MAWMRFGMLLVGSVMVVGACGGGSSATDDVDDSDTTGDTADSADAPDGDDTTTPDADVSTLAKFSFFATSQKAMIAVSGSNDGFGGDLRFGETGAGAGLRGADKICAAIAERSMPGSSAKHWHAFLSVKDGGAGTPVNAIDRIGTGPWYDRTGRLLANTKADMMGTRPVGGDAAILNDFPNEDGVPNHAPDGTQVDNHDFLTGASSTGGLYSATGNCLDWTSATGNKTLEGMPRVGHSWGRGGGGGGGGGGSMNSWMSSLTESGCAPGGSTVEMGPPNPNANTVGSGGGYGGIYCFAEVP